MSQTNVEPKSRRWLGRTILAAFVLAAALPMTTAAADGAIVVRGIQHEYGSCEDGGDAGYLMTGAPGQTGPALEGCWVVETFVVKSQFDGKAHFMATGEERFVGWLGNVQGTFRTTYVYTAKTDGDYANFLEIHGRCHHPIDATSGTGGFAGISGELSFTDVVNVSPPYYPYWGSIRLDASSTTTASTKTTSAATSSTSTGSNGVTC